MKKLFVMFAALAIAASASAQVGIIAGVSTPNNDIQTALDNYSMIDQYHVGLTLKLPLPLGLAIQPSIIYDVKGATVQQFAAGEVLKDESFSKTGYLELPVQVQLGLNFGQNLRVFGFVEPFVGYAVNMQNINVKSIDLGGIIDGKKASDWENVELAPGFDKSRLIYGAGAGVGVDLFKRLQLSARYIWDMGALYNEDGGTNFTTVGDAVNSMQKDSSNGIKLSLAIMF